MNYCLLPKNNIDIKIHAEYCTELLENYISHSLIYFLNKNVVQLKNLYSSMPDLYKELKKIVNTYEFIFTNVPNYNMSISKVKPENNIFFELMEIFHLFNINDIFNNTLQTVHITPNYNSSLYLLNILREDKKDINICKSPDICNFIELNYLSEKTDFFFFEFYKKDYKNTPLYLKKILSVLIIILNYQKNMGVTIIKIENIFDKVTIEIIYIICGLFEKVYIIKPSVSNNISNVRYIVCKKYMPSNNTTYLSSKINEIYNINTDELFISSLLENKIPYYFINKIEESNIIIGHQQLEFIDQIINIVKNKNKDDKIETIKRQNIQKCIQWCEKYKIPHNKFLDKTNIFLNMQNTKKDELDEVSSEI
jgi:hypothetical protein